MSLLQSTIVDCGKLKSTFINLSLLQSTVVDCGKLKLTKVNLSLQQSTIVDCGKLRLTKVNSPYLFLIYIRLIYHLFWTLNFTFLLTLNFPLLWPPTFSSCLSKLYIIFYKVNITYENSSFSFNFKLLADLAYTSTSDISQSEASSLTKHAT